MLTDLDTSEEVWMWITNKLLGLTVHHISKHDDLKNTEEV